MDGLGCLWSVDWLDDDVVLDTNWAKNCVKVLDRDSSIAGVTGPTLVPKRILANRDVFFFYGKTGILGLLGKFWSWFFLENQPYACGKLFKSGAWSPGSNFPYCLEYETLQDVDYLEACNMTLRRELVEKVGGYDMGFTRTSEWCELDLAMRIKELGYRLVFSPKVKLEHHISQAGAFTRRPHAKARMENFFKFYTRHIYNPRFDYTFKFAVYVLFLNGYWSYKALREHNYLWLGGWVGTITGLFRYFGKAYQKLSYEYKH